MWSWPRITNLLFFSPPFLFIAISGLHSVSPQQHSCLGSCQTPLPSCCCAWLTSPFPCFFKPLLTIACFNGMVLFNCFSSVQVYRPTVIRGGGEGGGLRRHDCIFLQFVAMCLCACLDSHALPEHTASMRAAHGQGMAALALAIGPLLVLIFAIFTYISIGLF